MTIIHRSTFVTIYVIYRFWDKTLSQTIAACVVCVYVYGPVLIDNNYYELQ